MSPIGSWRGYSSEVCVHFQPRNHLGSLADVERAMNIKQRLNNYWRNHRWLNGFNLTEAAMLKAFEGMQRWGPQTILAYPSSLYHFAKCLE